MKKKQNSYERVYISILVNIVVDQLRSPRHLLSKAKKCPCARESSNSRRDIKLAVYFAIRYISGPCPPDHQCCREKLYACGAVWNPVKAVIIVMPFKRHASCLEIHLTKLSKTGLNKNNPCWRTRLSFLWWPAARFMRSLPVKCNMKQGHASGVIRNLMPSMKQILLSCVWDEVLLLTQEMWSFYRALLVIIIEYYIEFSWVLP